MSLVIIFSAVIAMWHDNDDEYQDDEYDVVIPSKKK